MGFVSRFDLVEPRFLAAKEAKELHTSLFGQLCRPSKVMRWPSPPSTHKTTTGETRSLRRFVHSFHSTGSYGASP